MIRFLVGAALGAALCGVVLAALAVLFPLPDGPLTADRTPAPGAAPEPATAAGPESAGAQDSAAAPEAGATPRVGGETAGLTAPDPDAGAAPDVASGGDAPPALASSSAPEVAAGAGADDGPAVDTQTATAPRVGASATAPGLPEGDALAENAIPFEGAAGRPLLALVLIDDGAAPGLRPGLTALRTPLTVAVAADLADAPLVAAEHRGRGFEIGILPAPEGPMALSGGLRPEEVQGTLAVLLRNVPRATALIGAPAEGLPTEPGLAAAVAEALAITGHGLVVFGTGGAPAAAAAAAGVHADSAARLARGDDPAAIVAALEDAVARAAAEGSALAAVPLSAVTVGAMQSWLLSGGAETVTLAPVSAVLGAAE